MLNTILYIKKFYHKNRAFMVFTIEYLFLPLAYYEHPHLMEMQIDKPQYLVSSQLQ